MWTSIALLSALPYGLPMTNQSFSDLSLQGFELSARRAPLQDAKYPAVVDARRPGHADKAADNLRQHPDRTLEAILGNSPHVDKRADAPATSRRTTGSRRNLPR